MSKDTSDDYELDEDVTPTAPITVPTEELQKIGDHY